MSFTVTVISRRVARLAFFSIAGLICLFAGKAYSQADARGETPPDQPSVAPAQAIAAFCGDCHRVPLPTSYPPEFWPQGVAKGYEYYARSGRSDLQPPSPAAVLSYYLAGAASHQPAGPSPPPQRQPPVNFTLQPLSGYPTVSGEDSLVSSVRWVTLQPSGESVLLTADMVTGIISQIRIDRQRQAAITPLASLRHPARIETGDLDGDGVTDLVVADLGSFRAGDHANGRVVWLKPVGDAESGGLPRQYEPIVLLENVGRVADVRIADFNGDGFPDILVAEFGHYQTGGIWVLENQTDASDPQPVFHPHRISHLAGTSHVIPHDFSGDGRIDFVALTSQQHEQVELRINRGEFRFPFQALWRAPDLSYGLSGMQLVDLDRDGDQDILFVNGDVFDNRYIADSHGVQWLRNDGEGRFEFQRIADLKGAIAVAAGDFGNDGQIDIIATAWLPRDVLPAPRPGDQPLVALQLMQRNPSGGYDVFVLDHTWPRFTAVECGDFDGDGKLDFIAGGFTPSGDAESAPLVIGWNEGPN